MEYTKSGEQQSATVPYPISEDIRTIDKQEHKQANNNTSGSVMEPIQAGASSGVVESVRGILLCYTNM